MCISLPDPILICNLFTPCRTPQIYKFHTCCWHVCTTLGKKRFHFQAAVKENLNGIVNSSSRSRNYEIWSCAFLSAQVLATGTRPSIMLLIWTQDRKKTLVKSMYDQYNTLSSSARNFTPYDVVCASRSSPQSLKDGAESGTSKTHRLIRAFGRVDHAHIQSHLTNKVDIGMCAKFHTD
jgi:hypothetical protein